jgi:HAD superfamily hydrolase (TIGR01549 family)
VVFDVGETLVSENRAWLEWAEWLGIPPLTFLGVLGGAIARGEDHRYPFRLLRPDADLREERRRRLASGLPELFVPDDLFPDALAALVALREAGFGVGVAGNQPLAAERLFEDLAVDLDLVASSESLGVEKPDPAFFEAIAVRLDQPASSIAYVGDRVDNDVRPAAAAGMVPIFLRRGPWAWLQAGRDPVPEAAAVIDDLAGIVDVVRAIERTRRL